MSGKLVNMICGYRGHGKNAFHMAQVAGLKPITRSKFLMQVLRFLARSEAVSHVMDLVSKPRYLVYCDTQSKNVSNFFMHNQVAREELKSASCPTYEINLRERISASSNMHFNVVDYCYIYELKVIQARHPTFTTRIFRSLADIPCRTGEHTLDDARTDFLVVTNFVDAHEAMLYFPQYRNFRLLHLLCRQ